MDELLLRRAADLYKKSQDNCTVAYTAFLTPAEQHLLKAEASRMGYENMAFIGGGDWTERKLAVFLPYYMNSEDIDESEFIRAISSVSKFSSPGHRDYLGSILALGIERDHIGDICIDGETAWFFCLPSVCSHIVLNLDRVGRCGVKAAEISIADVPRQNKKVKTVTFTVKSPRLDAVASGLFGVSRTSMTEMTGQGLVHLNYAVCLKADALVHEGDIISVRGYGKGAVISMGHVSRKGRIFVDAEIYI